MKKIGIISDTHSYWDDRYLKYFEPCDEIWHCGDICSTVLAERWLSFVRCVPSAATATAATCASCSPRCCASSVRRWRY